MAKVRDELDHADSYYDSVVSVDWVRRYEEYYATEEYYKKKFDRLSTKSNLVSTDVADTIEWALPSLMKLFFGSEKVVSIVGVGGEDEERAKIMEELVSYIINRKNDSFNIFYDWFKDALITGMGVIKVYWEREEKQVPQEQIMSFEAAQVFAQDPNIQILEEPTVVNKLGDVKIKYMTTVVVVNQPKIENIVMSELRFSPNAKKLADCPFIAHKKRVTIDHLRKKELSGVYTNIKAIASTGNGFITDQVEELFKDDMSLWQSSEIAKQEVDIYECYMDIDLNNDGLLEKAIVTTCNDQVIRLEENTMGRHPFFDLIPMSDPHRIWPKRSMADLIAQLQDLKTALQRQIMVSVSLSNDPKVVVAEDAINLQDFIQGRNYIRKKPGVLMSEAFSAIPPYPLHEWTFQYLEYIEGQKENRTGITRYNQGLDARSLNKTATGISAIMGASNQRLELIARRFAETGVKDAIRFIISLVQRFMDTNTVIRIANKPVEITPDDLEGNFDLIINAGVGITTKEATMMNIQTLLTAMQQVAGMGIPIITPDNVYNLMKRWIQEMGFKNADDFVTDPNVIKQQMMQQALMQLPPELQQAAMMNGGIIPFEILMQMPPEIAMSIPDILLPPQAIQMKQQVMAQRQGGQNGPNGQANAPVPNQGNRNGGASQGSTGGTEGMVGNLPRTDNRFTQISQRPRGTP